MRGTVWTSRILALGVNTVACGLRGDEGAAVGVETPGLALRFAKWGVQPGSVAPLPSLGPEQSSLLGWNWVAARDVNSASCVSDGRM